MSTMQPPTIEQHVNGQQAQPERSFSESEVRQVANRYRQGLLELKAERDMKQAQVDELLRDIDEMDERIHRTEGATMSLLNLIQPQQEQPPVA